jgi:formylmethanofuran dehydrogenase subunit B
VVGDRIYHACRKGSAIFRYADENRLKPTVDGKEVDVDTALEKAGEMIANSKKFAIYGLDTIPLEAQEQAIELAEKKNGFIDDNSSFCLGDFVEMILKNELPSTTLDDVKDYAYVIFYWGTDPYHSLSRHLSLYTYYPRGKKRQRGYEEDRFLVIADIRESDTSKLAKKNARYIKVEDDISLVNSFIQVLDGKIPEYMDVSRVITEMKKSDFNVIFGGLGLKYGLDGRYDVFKVMVSRLNEVTNVYFLPAGFHSNMRGFNELMFEKTGHINKYSFEYGESRDEFEFKSLIRGSNVDTVLVIGSDPLNSLPFDVALGLRKVNLIVVDPKRSLTSTIADVTIPSAVTSVEQGGTMVRSDGARIRIEPLKDVEWTDERVLKRLKELV